MNKLTAFLVALSFSPSLLSAQDPASLSQREVAVAFVMVDGVYNTELMAPFDVFQHTVFHTEPGMKVFTVAPSREAITTFEGLRILPDFSFDDAPVADVLVVASARHSMDSDLENPELMGYVRRAGRQASYVLSLCDGAFVLAKAGLIGDRISTTFPGDIERYRKAFPGLEVVEDVSFVHDGPAITSAGGAVSYDAALYLVEVLYGTRVARGIAEGLVIDWDLGKVKHRVGAGS